MVQIPIKNLNYEDINLPDEFEFETEEHDDYKAKREGKKFKVSWEKCAPGYHYYKEEAVKKLIINGTWLIKPEGMEILPFEDKINKPNHYHKNEIDVHGYLQKHFPKEGNYTVAEGFHIGNVIKYVSRYKDKNGIEDLKKAEANLKILIELSKGE